MERTIREIEILAIKNDEKISQLKTSLNEMINRDYLGTLKNDVELELERCRGKYDVYAMVLTKLYVNMNCK